MKRVAVVVTSAFLLAGCAGGMGDFFPNLGGPSTVSLRFESEPPGADARTTLGPACRTPCTLPMPAGADFAVSFALTGFQPQTVPVKVLQPGDPRGNPNAPASVQFDPNPVFVALEAAPPPPTARKRPAAKPKPKAAQKPAAGGQPAPAPGMIPGSAPTSPPPGSPWPPPAR